MPGRRRFSFALATASCLTVLSLGTSACASSADNQKDNTGTGPTAASNATSSAGRKPRLVKIASTDQPVDIKPAPGFPKLMFVVDRGGRVMVLRHGRIRSKPFLDISNRVQDGYQEQGLLSIAFPGDYKRSKRFYVYYNNRRGNIEVDEFRRRSALRARRGSRRQVITINHQKADNHNGGRLYFYKRNLYFGTGDGGGAGDPDGNAQNLRSLLGKMIRIDPRAKRGRSYTVPSSNPFVGKPGRNEIFAYGFRNPFRWSFDFHAGTPPRFAIGDVGQDKYEEIDYVSMKRARGANFGWNRCEGFKAFKGGCPANTIKPVLALPHPPNCSVIGGIVVRDRKVPALYGRYIFSDFCNSGTRSFKPRFKRVRSTRPTGIDRPSITSYAENLRHRVFATSLDGSVYRLRQ